MKYVVIVLISMVCLQVVAEEKTCAVKGMECAGCVDMVKEKVCTDKFSVCDVKVKNKDAKLGEIHVKTVDKDAKVDAAMLTNLIADTTYTVEKCVKR